MMILLSNAVPTTPNRGWLCRDAHDRVRGKKSFDLGGAHVICFCGPLNVYDENARLFFFDKDDGTDVHVIVTDTDEFCFHAKSIARSSIMHNL